jgi:hypothetical protein
VKGLLNPGLFGGASENVQKCFPVLLRFKIMDYYDKQRNPNTFNYINSEKYMENIIRVNAGNGILESLPRE